MKTKDILAEKGTRVVTVLETLHLTDIVSMFLDDRIGSVVVVNNHNEIIGIVAPNDVLKATRHHPEFISTITVSEIMTRDIIVVTPEDDIDQLSTAPRLLKSFGYEVDPVSAGKEAAALIEANPTHYDLVITDYDMPGINGVELVKMMSISVPELPVIMISGREEAITASSRHYAIKKVLIKPYDKDELRVVIHSILSRM